MIPILLVILTEASTTSRLQLFLRMIFFVLFAVIGAITNRYVLRSSSKPRESSYDMTRSRSRSRKTVNEVFETEKKEKEKEKDKEKKDREKDKEKKKKKEKEKDAISASPSTSMKL